MLRERLKPDYKPRKGRTLIFTILGIAVVSACAGNITWVIFKLVHWSLPYYKCLSIGTLLALVDAIATYVNKSRIFLVKRQDVETVCL